jgi:hypothetical protein
MYTTVPTLFDTQMSIPLLFLPLAFAIPASAMMDTLGKMQQRMGHSLLMVPACSAPRFPSKSQRLAITMVFVLVNVLLFIGINQRYLVE